MLPGAGVLIDRLGVFDEGADGLNTAHEVGLWSPAGALLASAVVPAGTAAPLDANGLFRLAEIDPVLLPAGDGYVIAAFYSEFSDLWDATVLDFAIADSIRFRRSLFAADSGVLVRPIDPFSFRDPGYFGPSFEIVPEPGSVLVAGFVVGIVLRRRR